MLKHKSKMFEIVYLLHSDPPCLKMMVSKPYHNNYTYKWAMRLCMHKNKFITY